VDYAEQPPRPALEGLVKAFWTLDAGGGDGWISHKATPDGCVELIRRLRGRSRWNGDQPDRFAVGLSDAPVDFEISADARFAAIRLWPWTWRFLSDLPIAALHGRWRPIAGGRLDRLCSALPVPDEAEAQLETSLGPGAAEVRRIGKAVLEASSVAEMSLSTGLPPRGLQRWFAAHVGLPPRRYLRLLRFQKAFEEVPGQESLAGHAAAQGFADQAHMAREFRAMAGMPATQARRAAKGPFLP
jgi:AraC-like DNA-binding protein